MVENHNGTESARRFRVLIVEDQTAIRQMLRVVLESQPDFEVAGEAGELGEAMELARRREPDVVVLDWVFPGGGGAGFLRAAKAERLQCNVLVMSAGTDDEAIREALTSGAKGYVEKAANLEEFIAALRTVAGGGVYFGPLVAEIVERMVKRPLRHRATTPSRSVREEPDVVAVPAAIVSADPAAVPASVDADGPA